MPSNTTNLTILLGATLASALASSAAAGGGDGDLLYLRLNAKATSEAHGALYNHVNGEYLDFNDSYMVDSGQNLADYLAFEGNGTREFHTEPELADGSYIMATSAVLINEHANGLTMIGHSGARMALGESSSGSCVVDTSIEVEFKLFQPTIITYRLGAQTARWNDPVGPIADVWIWDWQTGDYADRNLNVDDDSHGQPDPGNDADYVQLRGTVLLQPGYYTFAGTSSMGWEWTDGEFLDAMMAINHSNMSFDEWTPGDLNLDGQVDGADLALILAAWGGNDEMADLNGDGIVNGADMALVLGNWT